MPPRAPYARNGLIGFAQGAAVSILALQWSGILIVVLLISWPWSFAVAQPPRLGPHLLKITIAIFVVGVAIALPVKHLDRPVGPMVYEDVTLASLSHQLQDDWQIKVRASDRDSAGSTLSFRTEQPMPRREVLHKLAEQTGLELHIGYCASGMTLLFGADPWFTHLHAPEGTDPAPYEPRP